MANHFLGLTADAAGFRPAIGVGAIGFGAAAKLVFGQQPTNANILAVISPAVTVLIQDASGNLVANATNSVTLALTSAGGATLGGTVTRAAVNGVVTFNDLTVDLVASYTLTATSTSLTSAVSSSFSIAFSAAAYPGLLLSLKANKNVYKDAAQASPATAYGDLVQQWHDEKEAVGGAVYPFAAQATGGTQPFLVPTASSAGGVYFGSAKNLAFSGLNGVATQNCTLAVVGFLYEDYAALYNGGGFLQIGTTFATGIFLGTSGLSTGTTNVGAPDAYYSVSGVAGLVSAPTVPLNLGVSVLTAQGGAANLALACAGVSANLSAVDNSTLANGFIGDDARLGNNAAFGWISRVLVYSPALSAANLAALKTNLAADVTLNSLFPLTYNFIVYHGNSLTVGMGHGATTPSQTYPYQCNALLTSNKGFILAADSGRTTAQLSAAHQNDIVAFANGSRTGKQVVIFWEGHNDITAGALTAAQIHTAYQNLAQAYKTAGYIVVLIDIIKALDISGASETTRTSFNTLMKTDFSAVTGQTNIYGPAGGITYANYLIDLDADAAFSNTANPTYYTADGVHLTPTGYGVVATYVKNALGLAGIT